MSAALETFQDENKEILVRDMHQEDLDEVDKIEQRSYDFPWSKFSLGNCFGKNYTNIVLSEEDKIVGYAIMLTIPPECHILNLCVDFDYRNQGLGSQLLESILSRAIVLGGHYAILEVRPSNTVAYKMYERHHFQEIGLRRNYYPAHTSSGREDALVLMREL